MPRAYSMDLRERVVAACARGELTREQVAQQFGIAEATLYEWLTRARACGSPAPKPHAGGKQSGLDRQILRDLVEQQNDAKLEEYAQAYEEKTGRRYSVSLFCRVLQEMKLSRKGRRYAPRSTSSPRSRPSA
jgi:transposase